MRVIDTHFHWGHRSLYERLCELKDYPRAERKGDGYVYWYNEGRHRSSPLQGQFDLQGGLEAEMKATGSDTAVVCTAGVMSGVLDQLPLETAIPIVREYNEELAEAQRQYEGQLFGTAYVPLNDTAEAIIQADYAVKELGLRGINLGSNTNGEPVDSMRLDPFYARVAELGVPLIVHPTDIVYGEQFAEEGYDGALHLTLGRLLDSSVTILRLVFSGVLARHPDLKIIHTHAGSLLPFQAGRFDKNVYRSKAITDLPLTPSEYLKTIYVDTVAPQSETIRYALDFYGADHVIYGTDHPCWSPAKAIAAIEGAHLTPEQREAVLHTNAETLFGLI